MHHAREWSRIVEEFKTHSENGLSEDEARKRIEKYGPNLLTEKRKRTLVQLFIEQLKNVLIYILLAAALISAVLGEWTDTVIIAAVIILNAVIGVIQENKSEKALEALKKMAAPKALVKREGRQQEVPSENIVPGDLVVLEAGRIIPCDLRLIDTVNLKVVESSLTGESTPVEKDSSAVLAQEGTSLGDRLNMAFLSTVVSYGRGKGIAVGTGMDTEIGRVAKMMEPSDC